MKPMLMLCIIASVMGMFQYGFSAAAFNPPQKLLEYFLANSLKDHYGFTLDEDARQTIFGITTVLYNLFGMIGALQGGWLANKFGQKTMLQAAPTITLIGGFLLASSKYLRSAECFIIGRLLVGLSSGLQSSLVPRFLGEISPHEIKGAIGTLSQTSVSLGVVVAMVLGIEPVLGNKDYWSIQLGAIMVPALVQLLLQIIVPESPSHLVLYRGGDVDRACQAIDQLYPVSKEERDLMLRTIQKEIEVNRSEACTVLTVKDLIKLKDLRLHLLVNLSMHFIPSISGMPSIYAYSTSFFQSAGVSCDISQYGTLAMGLIMFFVAMVVMPIIEAVGRRKLIIAGTLAMLIASISLTGIMNFGEVETTKHCITVVPMRDTSQALGNTALSIVLVSSILIFAIGFALGPGPIPWLATSELFPSNAIGAANTMATFFRWIGNLLSVLTFPQIQIYIPKQSFVPSILLLFPFLVLLYKYFPETKTTGMKSLDELENEEKDWKKLLCCRKRKQQIEYA